MPKRILPPNNVLKKLYEQGLSAQEIAEKIGANANTVASGLQRANIKMRTPEETKKLQRKRGIKHKVTKYWEGKKQPPEMVEKRISKIRGSRHYLWKGGKYRRQYRRAITKDKCESCGAEYNLSIHHIDFDHYNNSPDNLRVLCVSCHQSLHKQAYWDAIKNGDDPPKSNGPIGWER